MSKPMCQKGEEGEEVGYALPVEVIGIIAKHLIAGDAQGTCAALNITCRAVHEETLRALWRVVVKWGVKMITKVQGIVSAANLKTKKKKKKTGLLTAQKEINNEWALFMNSQGAKHIEYLVVHDLSYNCAGTQRLFERLDAKASPCFLPVLKAVITLKDDPLLPFTTGGGTHLTGNYRYGCEDLLDLTTTVKTFYDIGDHDVKKVLRQRMCVILHTNAQGNSPLEIRHRWKYSAEMAERLRSTLATCRVPNLIISAIRNPGNADHTSTKIVDLFLDAAYWQSRGDGNTSVKLRNAVTVCDLTAEQMIRLARAAQKATRFNPSMALANWDLASAFLPLTPSAYAEIGKILAVLRGTYLRAAQTIDKRRIGRAFINWTTEQRFASYFCVDPSESDESHLLTLVQPHAQLNSLMHEDPW